MSIETITPVSINGFQHHNFVTKPQVVETVQPQKADRLSKKAMLGIGAGIVAETTIGILLAKGKFSKAIQLAEHIDFKPAKTMDEAIKFAKENLGVKLQIGDNVEIANFLNETFVNISNKMNGKAVLPQKVKIEALVSQDGIKSAASYSSDGCMTLCPEFLEVGEIAKKRGISIKALAQQKKVENVFFHIIYHEVGHANHKDFLRMGRLSQLKARGIKDTHLTDEFLQSVKDNKIVKDFFEQYGCGEYLPDGTVYALSSPSEFVAETFAVKMAGKSVPKEVEELYKKFGGSLVT